MVQPLTLCLDDEKTVGPIAVQNSPVSIRDFPRRQVTHTCAKVKGDSRTRIEAQEAENGTTMADAPALRIIIVDDHAAVREGLARLIDDQPDMEVAGVARDGPEGLHLVQTLTADVVLMDVSMPGWSGVTTTKKILEACSNVKILAISRHQEPAMVQAMLDAGAAGYVLKQSASIELIEAIRRVAGGATLVDPGAGRPSASDHTRGQPSDVGESIALAPDEERVLQLLAASQSNAQIATHLAMSPGDAAALKRRAMEKARLASRVQVVAFARRSGWIA